MSQSAVWVLATFASRSSIWYCKSKDPFLYRRRDSAACWDKKGEMWSTARSVCAALMCSHGPMLAAWAPHYKMITNKIEKQPLPPSCMHGTPNNQTCGLYCAFNRAVVGADCIELEYRWALRILWVEKIENIASDSRGWFCKFQYTLRLEIHPVKQKQEWQLELIPLPTEILQ